jgi:hypothetical protein
MEKANHLEVSDGVTKIVSSVKCPLTESEVQEDQVCHNTICCRICLDGETNFICPGFYKAVLDGNRFTVDCRIVDGEKENII